MCTLTRVGVHRAWAHLASWSGNLSQRGCFIEQVNVDTSHRPRGHEKQYPQKYLRASDAVYPAVLPCQPSSEGLLLARQLNHPGIL